MSFCACNSRTVLRRECFDAVYGSSAGAMNATYFLSGQREGVSIYYEDIANKTFIDLGRLLDKNKDQGALMLYLLSAGQCLYGK